MAFSHPSVQSFFQRELCPHQAPPRNPDLSEPSDGFTAEEVERAVDPLNSQFHPIREYVTCDIGSLTPGPKTVTFMGRLVNLATMYGSSKSQAVAKGWHHLIVK